MTNPELPDLDVSSEVLSFAERLIQARDASKDILESRPTTAAQDIMGEVIVTDWPVTDTPKGTIKCVLSTPADRRKDGFYRVVATIDGNPKAGRNVYAYGEGTNFSASAQIPLGEGLTRIDELEFLLRACPFEEDNTPEDVGPENPMISNWKHGSET